MRRSRRDASGLVVGAAFLALGALLAVHFQHRINPDGISYLAVAQHIAAGRAAEAVNGYWGPLLSWLLAPLLAVGVSPLVAGRVVGLAAGLAAVWGAGRVAAVAGLAGSTVVMLQLALVPSLALGATSTVTPDMLFLAIWLHYLAVVHRSGFGVNRNEAVLAGLLGALGYLAKPYGFYIFILHFVLCGAWRWFAAGRVARRAIVTTTAIGMAAFLLVALPWVGVLGSKYGGMPISTSGPYNRALFGPGSKGQPLEHMGFVSPVSPHATSAWEDPTGLPLPQWGTADRGGAMRHQARLLVVNTRRLVLALAHTNYAGLLALPLSIFLIARARRRGRWLPESFIPAVMAVYPVGYLLIYVEQRYVWVSTVLGVILTFAVVERLAKDRSRFLLGGVMAVVALGCWLNPARTVLAGDRQTPVVMAAVAVLDDAVQPGDRLAADSRWVESIAVSYHLGARFHGVRGELDDAAAARALAEQGVTWYLDWSPDGDGAPVGDQWQPFDTGRGPTVPRIYHATRSD